MSANKSHQSSVSILDNLFLALPTLSNHHNAGSRVYALLKQVARREVEGLFPSSEPIAREFGPFGKLTFPYYKMGAIDSLNLFDLDELIIFSFYWTNRKRYKRVLDIGANIGLHSTILSKCGFEVRSYEPDPTHFKLLQKNLALNNCTRVQAFNAAVSGESGELEFVRVLGNTTASHLAGSKANPYGELERFPVKVDAIEPLIEWADLMKLDAEGHEAKILLATRQEHWLKTDALVEVENANNAATVYEHFKELEINLFSQKNSWQKVVSLNDMPTSYHDGTLFITHQAEMPWSGLA